METKALVSRHWLDLVFENRNKDYGAYSLRRAYDNRLMKAVFISVGIISMLFAIPIVLNKFFPVEIKPKLVIEVILSDIPTIIPKEKVKPAQKIAPPKKQSTTDLRRIEIVQHPVEPLAPVDEPVVNTSTSDIGVDGALPTEGVIAATQTAEPVVVTLPKEVTVAEVMPEYEGGLRAMMEFIQRKLRYPASAKRMGIEGTVYVSFVVNGDGTLRDIAVLKGVDRSLDEEAVRVVSMMKSWKGGRQGGFPVAVRMVLPIKLTLRT